MAATDALRQAKSQEPPLEFDAYGFESNSGGQAFPIQDENIVDLRFPSYQARTHTHPPSTPVFPARRMSGSSFFTPGGGSGEGAPAVEALCNIYRPPSRMQEPPLSPPNETHPTCFSLPHSPALHLHQDLARVGSRGRGSCSPRRTVRSAPYAIGHFQDGRWSTGRIAQVRPRHSASPSDQSPDLQASHHFRGHPISPPLEALHSSHPTSQPMNFPGPQTFISSPAPGAYSHPLEVLSPLPSQAMYQASPSKGEAVAHHDCGTAHSQPPDLFSCLRAEQVPPPPGDMNPSDPELTPHEQELRFEGDLYTPRWVRGHGNKREGWCGICQPGRWLVLKNSAFWYDKSFSHGISAATGTSFQGPRQTRRMDGSPDVWEGLCGGCNEWIALVSSKKKGTTWFRHAYKVSVLLESLPALAGH